MRFFIHQHYHSVFNIFLCMMRVSLSSSPLLPSRPCLLRSSVEVSTVVNTHSTPQVAGLKGPIVLDLSETRREKLLVLNMNICWCVY
jgi:hypothetical protein